MTIFDKISNQKSKNLPFVAYKKPNETCLNALLQSNDLLNETEDFSENGFLFSSFDGTKNIIFPLNECEFILENLDYNFSNYEFKENIITNISSKKSHISLIEKAISKINSSTCTKIVISRKENIEIEIDDIELFKKLLYFNSEAFTYIWFHPKIGLWMGAFGEQLLKIYGNKLQTMSLAGTQKTDSNKPILWKEKEIQEQKIVTDFIVTSLENATKNIKVSNVNTIVAGNVVHLKSDITAELKSDFNIKTMIKALHPTPAVCGFPKQESKNFILDNENYNREFYSGFVGELNFLQDQLQTNLFVNLRCLKVNPQSIDIFVGGGITKDSNPESEWDETVNKSMSIKRLL